MRIRTIRVERLKNLGDYEHMKLCVEAELQQGESATDTHVELSEFIEDRLEAHCEYLEKMRYARRLKEESVRHPFCDMEVGQVWKHNGIDYILADKSDTGIGVKRHDGADIPQEFVDAIRVNGQGWYPTGAVDIESADSDYDPFHDE